MWKIMVYSYSYFLYEIYLIKKEKDQLNPPQFHLVSKELRVEN